MSRGRGGTQRSRTGNHFLLPSDSERQFVAQVAITSDAATVSSWTFGSGTVIWKIWPALLLHTVFGALVTAFSLMNVLGFSLAIPNVMMTVLGSSFINLLDDCLELMVEPFRCCHWIRALLSSFFRL